MRNNYKLHTDCLPCLVPLLYMIVCWEYMDKLWSVICETQLNCEVGACFNGGTFSGRQLKGLYYSIVCVGGFLE